MARRLPPACKKKATTLIRPIARSMRCWRGLTGGISPAALLLAYTDWLSHLAASPQRQIEISQEAVLGASRFLEAALHYFSPDQGPWSLIKPQAQDRRFDGPEWESPPFNLLAQAFLLGQQWWHDASTGVRGVAKPNEAIVEFSIRQMLDVLAPSNFAATNPEVLQKTFQSGGANFVSGWQNWCSDWMQLLSGGKASGRQQRFRRRRKRCDLARQGRASQRTDRIDPVLSDHRKGASGADPDRAGLDHEVLHPRSVAAELAGEISHRARLHRLHDLLAQSRRRRIARSPSTIIASSAWKRRSPPIGDIVPGQQIHALGLLPGRHAVVDCRGRDGTRWRRQVEIDHAARRADGFHRGRRIDAVHQRKPGRVSRRHDVATRLPRHHADGRRIPAVAVATI